MSRPEKRSSRRGRPAQLSRDQIVDAALRLLAAQPQQAITMQALARALNSAPMSLYTHVRNRDDLMQAIAERVLSGVQVKQQPDWRDTVTHWARAVRSQLLAHPYVAGLMRDGIATPAAWLRLANPLLAALREAGLQAEALADAQRWISRVVVGSVLMELIMPSSVPQELSGVQAALARLSEADQQTWLEILPALGLRDDAAVFEFTLARTLAALEVLIDTPAR